MKTILLSIFLLVSSMLFGSNELDKELVKFYQKYSVKGDATLVDDYSFARRIYIDIAGRIPNLTEVQAYASDKSPEKKTNIIKKILGSEDYVNNFYNIWADTFRIRPERLSDSIGFLKGYPYMEYIRDNIRDNKPYNAWAKELLSGKGHIYDNPATSYILRDDGMVLDNVANTFNIFLGMNIGCAQCHDDPFQDYTQMQYYQLAAFFSSTDNRDNSQRARIKAIEDEIKSITKTERTDNNIRQLLSVNLINLQDSKKQLHLPSDYRYKDAAGGDAILPKTLDGKVSLSDTANNREQIADWIIAQPNFATNTVNKIWFTITGKPLTDDVLVTENKNNQILNFLGSYFVKNNYDIKKLIYLITTSDFYSRKSYAGNPDEYALQSILPKRMSSYQIWDSLLTLILPDTNYMRMDFSQYNTLIKVDLETMNGQEVLDKMKTIKDWESNLNKNFLKYNGIELVRSCFITNRNSFIGLFLKEFGSSDRVLIDSSNDGGSVTQILLLMNSNITQLIADKKSQIMGNYEKNNKNKDIIFQTILGRPSSIFEKRLIFNTTPDDLVWSLLNTREFLFRQ